MSLALLVIAVLSAYGSKKIREEPKAPPRQQIKTPKRRQGLLSHLKSIARASLYLISFISTVGGLAFASAESGLGIPWPTFPQVVSAGEDLGSPFSLPFLLTNASVLFPMQHATIACSMDRVEIANGITLTDSLFVIQKDIEISTSNKFVFGCEMSVPSRSVNVAEFRIRVDYDTDLLLKEWHHQPSVFGFKWYRVEGGGKLIPQGYVNKDLPYKSDLAERLSEPSKPPLH